MKTWEMIKELTENPGKEFASRAIGIFAEQKAYTIIDEYGELTIRIVNVETGKPIGSHHINRKWEEIKEVKEPVTFMEAINSGKCIKPATWNTDYWDLSLLMHALSDYDDEDIREIINGEWYIED